ncbi:MAG: hypothetical protein A3C12_00935 [Candidatus Sungbacteria bacterium RIFCSPHIGHO2_02_FULL_49_20]|uniref:Myb/SANT-like DNA-binding domain-containing protein n=1 Tax=Candidatus Sungbacteria bacterium RIFCSPHIGHO2_02_FULL_49_20 TaxID=1802272 RepID=A0A1G2KN77_9BACT|nr:MAG: hypothetical protein A3C12_00935 [Candidatus Sungbacteria bacterium RIFCSPHIGHO2_02_FULL_49_20]
MSNNHFTKKQDLHLEKAIASFGDCPICWPLVKEEFNKRFRRSQRTVEGLQTRWRALQKKAKQESLKRITQKDGFEAWFAQFFAGVRGLREQLKAENDKLRKTNRILEKERDDAVKALEDHLDKDERMRGKAKKLGEAALVINSD